MSEELKRTYNPCDECPYGIEKRDGSGNDFMCKICEFADLVKASRRAQQPNEPLTVDELKSMQSEPVWVKSLLDGTVKGAVINNTHAAAYVLWCGVRYDTFDNYGKSWLAYRRPPEAGEKG